MSLQTSVGLKYLYACPPPHPRFFTLTVEIAIMLVHNNHLKESVAYNLNFWTLQLKLEYYEVNLNML